MSIEKTNNYKSIKIYRIKQLKNNKIDSYSSND